MSDLSEQLGTSIVLRYRLIAGCAASIDKRQQGSTRVNRGSGVQLPGLIADSSLQTGAALGLAPTSSGPGLRLKIPM